MENKVIAFVLTVLSVLAVNISAYVIGNIVTFELETDLWVFSSMWIGAIGLMLLATMGTILRTIYLEILKKL